MVRAGKSARAAEPGLAEDELLALVAEDTGIPVRLIRTAVRYWGSYAEEVNAEIAAAEAAEEATEDAWWRERRLRSAYSRRAGPYSSKSPAVMPIVSRPGRGPVPPLRP